MGVIITRRGGSGGGGELAYCDVKNSQSYAVDNLTFPDLAGKEAFVIIAHATFSSGGVLSVERFSDGSGRMYYKNDSGSMYFYSMDASTAETKAFFNSATGEVNLKGFGGTSDRSRFSYSATYRAYYAK